MATEEIRIKYDYGIYSRQAIAVQSKDVGNARVSVTKIETGWCIPK
jgi:hypothetical protein